VAQVAKPVPVGAQVPVGVQVPVPLPVQVQVEWPLLFALSLSFVLIAPFCEMFDTSRNAKLLHLIVIDDITLILAQVGIQAHRGHLLLSLVKKVATRFIHGFSIHFP
jgi:hypothetical protein